MTKGRKTQKTRNNGVENNPLPIISYGDKYYKLLIAMEKPTFTINSYSDKIPRSTTRSRLKWLAQYGLVHYEPFNTHILDKGKDLLDEIERSKRTGSKTTRIGGRKNQLSEHKKTFTIIIKDRKNFFPWCFNRLDCEWRENTDMKNWTQVIAKFEDATVIVNTEKVIISFPDMVADTTEEADAILLKKLFDYIIILDGIGLTLERTSVERGHWARIDSALANYIYDKIGERYFLRLPNGKEFHVDNSPDKDGVRHKEDEASGEPERINLDKIMTPILMGEIDVKDLKDLGHMKEILGLLIQIEYLRTLRETRSASRRDRKSTE